MEPGPSKSSDKHDKGIRVPTEVIRMMSNVRWPQVRMQDMLYNSLLKEPYTVFENVAAQEDLARDMKYRDGEKVAKKIRESFKEQEGEEKLGSDQDDDDDDDDEEHLEIDLSKADSSGPSRQEMEGNLAEVMNINNQDGDDDNDEGSDLVEEEEIVLSKAAGDFADIEELDYGSSDENFI